MDNGEHVLINSETGDIVSGANYESWIKNYKANGGKKGLDNSDNNTKINSVNGNNTIKKKEGDNDGQQQSNPETDKQQRDEQRRQAIAKLRKWMDSGRPNGIMSVFDKKRGGGRLGDGLVENTIEAKPETKAIFEAGGIPTPIFNQLKKNDNKAIDTFKNALSKVKQSLGDKGASVELKDDYTDINLYLSEDGESGFAIKPNGDIVSVFSSKKERGRAHYMLEIATEEGGRQLDCFDIYLTKIYEAHGFKPVAKMKWDDEYIPDGWNKETFKDYNNGEPDVVFMVYDPEDNIAKKHKEWEEMFDEEFKIPYISDYNQGEDFQHIFKWRSPAEREAIYNNTIEQFNNAKTTAELKKVVFDKNNLRKHDDLNALNKEQRAGIVDTFNKRLLELLKGEDINAYNEALAEQKRKAREKAKKKIDARVLVKNTFVDNLIRFADLKTDAKKDFDESKVKRDKDGKFAKKSGNKDSDKKDSSKDADKDNKDNDKQKDNKKATNNKKTKSENKSVLDYGDLPTELHEPFKRLNTTTKPAELIFNNDNEYGLTIDDVKEISSDYSNPVDTTYCNINSFEINNDEGDTEEVDLTNRDNLQSPIEKFLYDFTCNADNAKNEWGAQWENEIKPQLKQMIKNAPVIKGKAYRVETFHANREEIVEGGKINFDCRSVSDDNKGYETVCNFSQPDYEYGEDIIIFEFPEDTRGLNIQGCSVYPNQHEYLVDGDFIMETVEKDEFDRTIVRLKKAE